MTKQIIVIGRGNSGTRCMIHTLRESGVFCGRTNPSGDLLPPQLMYKAVRIFGRLVDVYDAYEFDFRIPLLLDAVPDDYTALVQQYLASFAGYDTYGWKLPEATLALPWLVRIFPDAYYIHWVRDGRDNILHWHGTEQEWYGVDIGELPKDRMMRAALSWDYHEELIAQTPKPTHWLRVRFEDFVTDQERELQRLEDYLGMHLFAIRTVSAPVGRWQREHVNVTLYMPILERYLEAHGYL